MSNIWFTADTHFGHKRIIELAKRPFSTVEEMDEVLIQRWNERVRYNDTVYHLGDFSFRDQNEYLFRLNGIKHLIRGNHDHRNRLARDLWQSIEGLSEIKVGDIPVVLCHYALRVWNRSHYGALHLYGHSHGSLPGDSQSCDVGVDCWDYRPVSIDEILNRLMWNEPRGEPDHHTPKPVKE